MMFTFQFIKGLMVGVEYHEDEEEELFYIVVDLGIIRCMIIKQTTRVVE